MNRLRIVQMLDSESASDVLRAVRMSPSLGALVAVDSAGQLWWYGTKKLGDVRRDWHRLPLPPLPDDGGGNV